MSIERHRDDHQGLIRFMRKMGHKAYLEQQRVVSYQHYDTEDGKRLLADNIIQRSLLRGNTKFKTGFEAIVGGMLMDMGIPALYTPFSLPIRNNTDTVYVPDFFLPSHSLDGKGIILEPHHQNYLDIRYLTKLGIARERFGLHISVITDLRGDEFGLRWLNPQKALSLVDQILYIGNAKSERPELRQSLRDLFYASERTKTGMLEVLLGKLNPRTESN